MSIRNVQTAADRSFSSAVGALLLSFVVTGALACSATTTTPTPAPEVADSGLPTTPPPAGTGGGSGGSAARDAGADVVEAGKTCFKCGDVQSAPDFAPEELCADSKPLFDALFGCLCGLGGAPAKCAETAQCGESACAGAAPTQDCGNCAATSCGPQLGKCLNDK